MANHEVNAGRRRFLTTTTAVVGAIGAGFAAVPFVTSFKPSARAQTAGAPVTVNISKIDNEPGMRIIQQWRGKPVWVFKRTPEQLATLKSLDGNLRDPKSDNIYQTPGLRQERGPDHQGQGKHRRHRRYLHPLGLLSELCAGNAAAALRCRLEGWLLLPLPSVPLRSGRPRLSRRPGTVQS